MSDKEKEFKSDVSQESQVLTPVVVKDKQKKALSSGRKKTASKQKKSKMGAPNRTNEILEKPVTKNFIEYLIKQKAIDSEIARKVNVPYRSFMRWKARNKDLWQTASAQLELSMAQRAEIALMKRVEGHYEERAEYTDSGEFKGTQFKYFPPSDTAIQYLLNNRDPANWKSKVEHNHALEELPLAVNFVLDAPDEVKENLRTKKKAIVDDFGNEIIIDE